LLAWTNCLLGVMTYLGVLLQFNWLTLLRDVLADFTERNRYLEERKKWLQKVLRDAKVDFAETKCRFLGFADVTDHRFFDIYRNVILAFHTVELFRRDVEQAAERYCAKRPVRHSPMQEVRLSEAYILEEIAVNVRVRLLEGIQDEYYPFGYPKPMLRVYTEDYGFSAFDLAGSKFCHTDFTFFEWNQSTDTWRIVQHMSPSLTHTASASR
jgi:hypothetical protein